jgi:ABC-type transport system involved in multi-copper enzyme maturation permease subunit
MRTTVIIADTFRALRSRSMFWILLWISVLLVIVLGGFSIKNGGWTMFYGLMDFQGNHLLPGSEWERSFYLGLYRGFIDWWIMSFALLLALFPVTNIFPETLQPGTIDFYLSKSVSRLGLFVGKYIGCLLVMIVQVGIVALGGFVIISLRLGEWHWELLWCMPLAVLIFSFILSVNVLVGVTTRSGVAALLWTILFWGMLFMIQKAESDFSNPANRRTTSILGSGMQNTFDTVQEYAHTAMLVLPKTRETARLFDKVVHTQVTYSLAETLILRATVPTDQAFNAFQDSRRDEDAAEKFQIQSTRSPGYVVGSSLLFELTLLVLAYIRIRRADF